MAVPVFIGDEVTAAGYRLAGMEVRVTTPAASAETLQAVCTGDPPLVLITAACAAGLPETLLRHRLQSLNPPLLVVGDAAGEVAIPDLVRALRARVGLS